MKIILVLCRAAEKTQARQKVVEFVEEHWSDFIQNKWFKDFLEWIDKVSSKKGVRPPAPPSEEQDARPPQPLADPPNQSTGFRWFVAGGAALVAVGAGALSYGMALQHRPPAAVGLRVVLAQPDGGARMILLRSGPTPAPPSMAP